MKRMADNLTDRRYRFTVFRPADAAATRPITALDLPSIGKEHLDLLRQLLVPYLGAGFVLDVDGAVVARGPDISEPPLPSPSPEQVQRLTEMAVQHHEYLCAELRRMREEYEQEFAQERAIMRTLRQRWMERICDDQVRGEDAVRYLFETVRAGTKKSEPPTPGET
jgi:hypothetical protein